MSDFSIRNYWPHNKCISIKGPNETLLVYEDEEGKTHISIKPNGESTHRGFSMVLGEKNPITHFAFCHPVDEDLRQKLKSATLEKARMLADEVKKVVVSFKGEDTYIPWQALSDLQDRVQARMNYEMDRAIKEVLSERGL